ncbi:Transcription initiation factor TFIID subunit 13 [Thoreauomyces humboldtii]|nr:Transcription initiation factor TFIID subunit 13 [Thoreauomyces humboldtii]
MKEVQAVVPSHTTHISLQHRDKHIHKKRPFTKEVRNFMYGFGDVPNPSADTTDLMEELLLTYLADLCSQIPSNRKPKTTDFLHALRNDPKKLARAHELLALDQDIKNARKAFDEPEGTVGKKLVP